MNLMTAGRGIAHSERTPDVQRRDGQKMLGLQSWIALPAGSEEIAPSFQHYAAEALPTVRPGSDIVIRVLPNGADAAFADLRTEVTRCLSRSAA
jgi:redox-sensitive bicupin YhaK (pirin superfamily)